MDKNKENKEAKDAPAAAVAPTDETSATAKQLSDYMDSLQRLQAEFENYKKRVDREKSQFKQFAAAEVIKSFLPVLDSFELAVKSIAGNNDKLVKGIEMIYGQFYSVLEAQGLRPIKAVGERLDPYKHEVLMQELVTDAKKDGIVAEEFQKGYMLHDIVLRYSKVKVLKFADNKNNDKNIENVGGK